MNGLGKLGGGLAAQAGESEVLAKVCGRRARRERTALGNGAERKNQRVCVSPRCRVSTHAAPGASASLYSAPSLYSRQKAQPKAHARREARGEGVRVGVLSSSNFP